MTDENLFAAIAPNPVNGVWVNMEDEFKTREEVEKEVRERMNIGGNKEIELIFPDAEGLATLALGYSMFFDFDYYQDIIETWEENMTMLDLSKEILKQYIKMDIGELTEFETKFIGKYESKREFAEEMLEGSFNNLPEFIERHFDYDSYARDLFIDNFVWVDLGIGEGGVVFEQ